MSEHPVKAAVNAYKTAWRAGEAAFKAGQAIDANPYARPKPPSLWVEWRHGWLHAQKTSNTAQPPPNGS